MKTNDKNGKESPYPPQNVSVHYYTDPVYSRDAFCGFDDTEVLEEVKDKKEEAPDEPIESWGWVNNVD